MGRRGRGPDRVGWYALFAYLVGVVVFVVWAFFWGRAMGDVYDSAKRVEKAAPELGVRANR